MIVLCVYVHTHPYRWHICVHSVLSIILCPSLLPLSCASCLPFPDFVRRTLCVYFCTVTLCCVIPNSAECWMRCGQFIRETEQGEGRMVETCSVMCAVIDMLTSSFQAAASKPRLATLIGFNRVCSCIWQCNLRHSVVSNLFRNAELSPFFAVCLVNLCRLQQKNIIMKVVKVHVI